MSRPIAPRRRMTTVTPDGVTISIQEWGDPDGPEILFIHGYCQSHLSWLKQVTGPLADAFRLVTYDLRGHGESDKPLDPAAYRDGRRWADEVAAVIEAAGLVRPVVSGWSYGGRIICDYLLAYGPGRIGAVHFVAAATSNALNRESPAGGVLAAMASTELAVSIEATRKFLRLCFSREPAQDDLETMLAWNMMVPQAVREAMSRRSTPYEPMLGNLEIPVLVTHGDEDRIVVPAISEWAARTIPAARLSMWRGIGHAPFREDPERFDDELAGFVRESWRP